MIWQLVSLHATSSEHTQNGAEISYLTRQTADVTMARICRRAGYVLKYKDENGMEQVKPKFSIHSLRRRFYNSLSGIEDPDAGKLSWVMCEASEPATTAASTT